MSRWFALARQLYRGADAATMVEYALMMVFVAMSCVVAVTTFGSAISGLFQRAVNGLR